MYGKILSIDKDHDAVIQLPSGEKVYIGGGPVTDYVFLCTAFQKNMFGMPIKKIWHFFMFDSRGEKEGAAFWNAVAPFVKAAGKENVVFLDFYEYPPKYVLFGYVMHFDSIEQMKKAHNYHSTAFHAGNSLDGILSTGLLKLNDTHS